MIYSSKHFLLIALLFFSFGGNAQVSYAYVASMEKDLSNPKEEKTIYIFSDVIEIPCFVTKSGVELQFNRFYLAEVEHKYRTLFRGGGNTSAWIYSTWEEAAQKRRRAMAYYHSEPKRTIRHFYYICNP